MDELEKTARALILAITEKTLKSLKDKGLLKEPSKLQMLCSSPEMKALIKKLSVQKYDPRRLFRKGDIVEMDTHGRNIAASMKKAGVELGKRYTVTRDESDTGHNIGYVSFAGDDGNVHHSMFFWLKLVTPAEEIERYYIEHDTTGFAIVDRLNVGYVAHFKAVQHPHAKEAAEAVRDRLNAEWRKEMGK